MVLYTLVKQVPEMWEMPPHRYSYMIIFILKGSLRRYQIFLNSLLIFSQYYPQSERLLFKIVITNFILMHDKKRDLVTVTKSRFLFFPNVCFIPLKSLFCPCLNKPPLQKELGMIGFFIEIKLSLSGASSINKTTCA